MATHRSIAGSATQLTAAKSTDAWLYGLQSLIFFAKMAEGGVRLAASAGETLLLPAGWPHAVVTTEDTVAVGGNFLHGLDFRRAPPAGDEMPRIEGHSAKRHMRCYACK